MNTSTSARFFKTSALAAAITVASVAANAALYDRGNGMIYDSDQNITWLQDANYAQTSRYHSDGQMTWQDSNNWAATLVYGGFDDWRLSSARLVGDTGFSYDGSTDAGYNNSRSELGHLFLELGNNPAYDFAGQGQSNYGWSNSSFIDPLTNNSVSFFNTGNKWYWEAESYIQNFGAWTFSASNGYQVSLNKSNVLYAWAVRDGDVLPVNEVPVPAAAWLMGSGLISLAGLARRKK